MYKKDLRKNLEIAKNTLFMYSIAWIPGIPVSIKSADELRGKLAFSKFKDK